MKHKLIFVAACFMTGVVIGVARHIENPKPKDFGLEPVDVQKEVALLAKKQREWAESVKNREITADELAVEFYVNMKFISMIAKYDT